jgi:hypothetical protein
MESEGSLPRSKEPSTGPYSEPDQCSLYHPILPKTHFNIIYLQLGISSGLFPFGFPNSILYAYWHMNLSNLELKLWKLPYCKKVYFTCLTPKIYLNIVTENTYRNSSVSDINSGGARFETHSTHRLRFFVIFLSPSRSVPWISHGPVLWSYLNFTELDHCIMSFEAKYLLELLQCRYTTHPLALVYNIYKTCSR